MSSFEVLPTPALSLRQRLLAAAEEWCAATGRTLGALSSVVSNHGATLDRLKDPANRVTDVTIEAFARWLANPANWPDGGVGVEARTLAEITGVVPNADVRLCTQCDLPVDGPLAGQCTAADCPRKVAA